MTGNTPTNPVATTIPDPSTVLGRCENKGKYTQYLFNANQYSITEIPLLLPSSSLSLSYYAICAKAKLSVIIFADIITNDQ